MHKIQVKRYINKKSNRLFIYFMGVRYSSLKLNTKTCLLNKPIFILVNPEDLRSVDAYEINGEYIDTLSASGSWGINKHDIAARKRLLEKIELYGLDIENDTMTFFKD